LATFAYRSAMHVPVEVLVGTDRHWQAEEMADETVKAARQLGLDMVAALLTGAEGGVHVSADVTVDKGVLVDVTIVVVSLRAFVSARVAMEAFAFLLMDLRFDCDRWYTGIYQCTNANCMVLIFLTQRQ
jgi:hypothetical protein